MENSRQLTPNSIKKSLRHALTRQRPVFVWGPPGVGKSDIIHQIGEEFNAHVVDVRLSLWEPTDIKGIPYYDATNQTMSWAPPIELPNKEMAKKHENIILFLDEMNSAPPAVQAAAYQLILNRKVGTYELPDNVMIVAAGNRDGDKGVTNRMPAPLANRFIHLEITVGFDDWFEWSVLNDIHSDVVGYLTVFKNDLYDFDPRSGSRSFATPRSWTFVSELLDDDLDTDTLTNLVSGAVGEGIAVKFMAHRKHSSNMPNPTDILDGKEVKLKTTEISAMYSLMVSMCYELKDFHQSHKKTREDNKKYVNKFNNFLRFSMDNFETELVVVGIQMAMTHYNLPIDPSLIECFPEFHKRFSRYINAAHA